jgi:CDP-glucose 4,6-dehydratase
MENPLGQRLRELPGPLLLTGHTGFKGTWMAFLLEHLNVPLVGFSLPAEKNSLFDRAEREGAIDEVFADIRDYEALEKLIDSQKPSTIIHMAAQSLVLKSYENPRETFHVNVMGTVNVLDIAFKRDFVKAIIVVTTDKVYRNDNLGRAFAESDPLEGRDPYSASKVGTEAVVAAWQQIAQVSGGPKVVSVRAGNVIGGGDFAEHRIIPDLLRGVMSQDPVEIRNPESTRPWQYVIEPLVGYIKCLEHTLDGSNIKSLNFGPNGPSLSVNELIEIGSKIFPNLNQLTIVNQDINPLHESQSLSLMIDLSKQVIDWTPKWNQEEAILKTFEWWCEYLKDQKSVKNLCMLDIKDYFKWS